MDEEIEENAGIIAKGADGDGRVSLPYLGLEGEGWRWGGDDGGGCWIIEMVGSCGGHRLFVENSRL